MFSGSPYIQLYPDFVVADAGYHSRHARPACLEGTRKFVIAKLLGWKNDKDAAPICLLSGPAGYGKSAVAQTVAEKCARDQTLLASFCFWRNAGGRSEFTRFITTLAYQITVSVPEVKAHVERALRDDQSIVHQSTSNQLQKLILEPLMSVPSLYLSPKKHIIVVDAIDECNDRRAIEDFIDVLASACCSQQLPLRWLITSRNENHIHRAFTGDAASIATSLVALEDFDAHGDIQKFLESRFRNIIKRNPRLMRGVALPWPSIEDIVALVEKSSGVFIFAATLVEFVTDDTAPPDQKLKAVLTLHSGLDPLYDQVLRAVPEISYFRKVLTTLMLVQEQPSINMLADLLELSAREVLHALMTIQSIIRIPSDNNSPIQLNHTSLRDFLVNDSRSRDLFIDPSAAHSMLALDCVKLMKRTLQQDKFPVDVALNYAAKYWTVHLGDSRVLSDVTPTISALDDFSASMTIESWINVLLLERTSIQTMQKLSSLLNDYKVNPSFLYTAVALILHQRGGKWRLAQTVERIYARIQVCLVAATL